MLKLLSLDILVFIYDALKYYLKNILNIFIYIFVKIL